MTSGPFTKLPDCPFADQVHWLLPLITSPRKSESGEELFWPQSGISSLLTYSLLVSLDRSRLTRPEPPGISGSINKPQIWFLFLGLGPPPRLILRFCAPFLVPPDGLKNGTVNMLLFYFFTKFCMRSQKWDHQALPFLGPSLS